MQKGDWIYLFLAIVSISLFYAVLNQNSYAHKISGMAISGQCTDECGKGLENTFFCIDSATLALCKNTDSDSCLEVSGRTKCTSGNCVNGRCECSPSWECTQWSICVDGAMTRQCTDKNSCGPGPMPDEQMPCSAECSSSFECSSWGVCSSGGVQERLCSDVSSCGLGDTIETRLCQAKNIGSMQNGNYEGAANGQVNSTLIGALIGILVFNVIFWIFFVAYRINVSSKRLNAEKKLQDLPYKSVKNIENYIRNDIAQEGHHINTVRQQLIDEGWNKVAIGHVVSQIPKEHISNSLTMHVEIMKHFGESDDNLKIELKRKGWDDKTVQSTFDKLRHIVEDA